MKNDNSSHNCMEVISKVMLALDGELSSSEEKAFMEELQRCSHCLEHFEIEKSFKSFLCSKVCRQEVSKNLIASIREKIKGINLPSSDQ